MKRKRSGRRRYEGQSGAGLGDARWVQGAHRQSAPAQFRQAVRAKEFAETGKDLQHDAKDGERHPSEEDEAPMQRAREAFIHGPGGMAPFVEAHIGDRHEDADDENEEGERIAFGEKGQARLRIEERAQPDDREQRDMKYRR